MDEQFNENEPVGALIKSIQGLVDLDESLLTDEVMQALKQNIEVQFSEAMKRQSMNQMLQNFEDQGLSKQEATAATSSLKEFLRDMIYGENVYVGNKKVLIDTIVNKLFDVFDKASERYHSFSIELPIMLEEGAQVPTYAHDDDAAADMYALENVTIPAHFQSVPIKTGVHIQLPEGWVAFLLPRSSIGAKTPLRLSNSVGVIDSGYRGEVRALYDNIGDEPYQIHKGDRIAQLLVMPSHRFQAKVVKELEDSDRGEAGFGSSGK